jgi:hypothetical protein
VVAVVGAMVAGVFFGQGLSRTAVEIADGLTWLTDDPTGRVIQVNPATGQPEVALQVGDAGDDLDIAQYDGELFVTNHTTGQLMAFDLTSILISGQRAITSGGAVDTLHTPATNDAPAMMFLVDDHNSTISAIDPVSTDTIGTIWVSPTGLADAATDATGTVWALEDDGTLHELTWTPDTQEFTTKNTHTIDQSADGSVLVAHDQGVTIFGPDHGIVTQIGTPHQITADTPKLTGDLATPETAPHDLVPAASPDTSTVVIATPDTVREVNLTGIDCTTPGTPEVFRHTIYVPCHGAEKVIRLTPTGTRNGNDIPTPGTTTPELVLDDNTLIINTPGTDHGLVINNDGTIDDIIRNDPDLPTTNPHTTTPPPNPHTLDNLLDNLLGTPHTNDNHGNQSNPGNHGNHGAPGSGPETEVPESSSPSDGPDESDGPSTEPGDNGTRPPCRRCPSVDTPGGGDGPGGSDGPDETGPPELVLTPPANVTAQAGAEGQVTVTWTHAGVPADEFVVSLFGGGELVRVAGDIRQAVITVPPGDSVAFVVSALTDSKREDSQPSNTVTTSGVPGAPTQVSGSSEYLPAGDLQRYVVTVRWGAASGNGSQVTSYDVSVTTPDGTQTVTTDGNGRRAVVEWSCSLEIDPNCAVGGDFTATVTASNDVGVGPASTISVNAPPQPPPPLPAGGADLVTGDRTRWSGGSIEGFGETVLTLRPPDDWESFAGVCEWRHTGNVGGADTGSFACNASQITVQINNGYIREPSDGRRNHSIVFTASNEGGSVQSATHTWTTTQNTLCQGCQIP